MATTKRLDEAEIEERLRGRPIAIVKGSFKNTREPARWLCLSDSSHGIFKAPPRQIIHANGNCPKCGKVAKLTDEIISAKLSTRPIRLVIQPGGALFAQDPCSCRGYAGVGGPCYAGGGGPAFAGVGGPAYDSVGGPCYAGVGGSCYSGIGGTGTQCPAVCLR